MRAPTGTQVLRMEYVGPNTKLRGRQALVRASACTHPGSEKLVRAQFDFPPGTEFDSKGRPLGHLEPIAHLSSRDIVPSFADEHPECFGWREYPWDHFEEIV